MIGLTISEVLHRHSLKSPDSIYCIDLNGGEVTFIELNSLVDKFCSYLEKNGVKKDQVVSLKMSNSITFVVCFFGVIRYGAIVNPCPSIMTDDEFNKISKYIDTSLLISDKRVCSEMAKKVKISIFPGFKEFKKEMKNFTVFNSDNYDVDRKFSCLFLSSGTTSTLPKAIMHKSIVLSNTARLFSKRLGFNQDTRHLSFLPCGNTSFIGHSLLPTLISGGTMIIARNYLSISRNIWNIVNMYKISFMQVVPTIAVSIYNSFDKASKSKLNQSKLKYISCGSDYLSTELQDKFLKKTGKPLLNMYGLSEIGAIFFNNPNSNTFNHHSIGTPLNEAECKLIDLKSGNEMYGVGSGELYVKSPTLFVEYYNQKNSIINGFFKTGDILERDSKGDYYYKGRTDSLIIRGGVNISPVEIEQVLLKIEGVMDVAIFGVQNDIFGMDIVCCYTTIGAEVQGIDIKTYANKKLSPIKVPSLYMHFDSFPKTSSKKVRRQELYHLLKSRLF